MFSNKEKGRYLVIVLLNVGLFVFLTERVFALTISPVKMEIAGDPGQTLEGQLELFNEQDETKTFYSSTANFEARGESGAPYFLPETNTGLASWIKIQESVVLKKGERQTIPFSIKIPQGTEAGGYFAAIFWGTSPPQAQEGGQIALGGKLGMLILLSVTGETKQSGGLLDLKLLEGGRVVNSLPVVFAYRFSNDGRERIKPVGELKIKNIFGVTSAVLDANKSEGNVLPGSIRKFTVLWHSRGQKIGDLTKMEELELMTRITEEGKEKKGFFETAGNQWRNFAFGLYTAKLNLAYGKDNKTAEASYR
ncbi:MAG: hypothetical protein ACK4NX_03710, partial [Candidatus Paceibacteria bacterium]